MSLKQKWKLFAFGHYFQNDLTVEAATKLFDELSAAKCGYDCEELLKPTSTFSPKLWPEYASIPIENAMDDMYALAMHAQDVENMEG